ncbi:MULTISPECIES: 6-hydroxymethylpterin diphosphokinase MptE-like protein [Gammaproteobacteria]|uniref:6-hydroxymethylpterin diphosphokinase MptE-like protein n=1 Tax=Gammaproteobacteria TaxID=1236 RepID=UPI003A919F31
MKTFAKNVLKKFIKREDIPYPLLEELYPYRLPDSRELKSLRNKFRGERCFIVGNGPSLNKLDLNMLKNEYSFAVNGIFYKTREMGFKPTFYTVEDSHVMRDNVKEINDYITQYRFFPIDYKNLIYNKENAIFFRMNTGFYQRTSPNFKVPRFSTDVSKRVYCGQSVTMINLQLAHYFGFDEVYLIGMDFDYEIPSTAVVDNGNIMSTEDDCNHFHPDYFGKGKSWHDPHLDRVLNSYRMMKIVYEATDKKIYNATAGGKLEVFERVNYDELFEV